MTREEIKAYIMEAVEVVTTKGKSTDYIAGQVVGMVKAFKKLGALEAGDILAAEILEEI